MFSDPDDEEVIKAKENLYYQDGGAWKSNTELLHRALSNNTVIYKEKPSWEQLSKQFDMIRYSGEPSFANFQEMQRRRDDVQGGNPLTKIM